MSTTMAISSSRTRSNSPIVYRPRVYSPATSFSSSSPILTPSIPRSLRFSGDRIRPNSPGSRIRGGAVVPVSNERKSSNKKACLCSPTTHPGSYRCSKHKNQPRGGGGGGNQRTASFSSGLSMRRSAMANSLVRIGVVEGNFVKRSLSALISPPSLEQRPRADFRPRRSRLSVMSRAAAEKT